MYIVDTNAISELRKGWKGHPGVVAFLREAESKMFLPVQVVGELRSGIETLRRKGDLPQASRVEEWFQGILQAFAPRILDFDSRCAQKWGILMGRNDQHPVDKQIAAIALVYELTVVTRNTDDFAGTGVKLLNPFFPDSAFTEVLPR